MDSIIEMDKMGLTSAALAVGLAVGWFIRSQQDTVAAATQETTPADEPRPHLSYSDEQGELKLILGVRTDLKMTKGKMAAQCGHAAVAAFKDVLENNPGALFQWEEHGEPKIAVKVQSEEEMIMLYKAARQAHLPVNVIQDAGRTQIARGSRTVIAIGPALKSEVDKITGHLKLL